MKVMSLTTFSNLHGPLTGETPIVFVLISVQFAVVISLLFAILRIPESFDLITFTCMKFLKKPVLAISNIALFALVACCQNDSNPVYSCEGILYDKSLANIRACVIGEWQVHYRRGGIGFTRENFANTFLKIKENDSIYFTFEGISMAETRIMWNEGVSIPGPKTYTINFDDKNGSFYIWVVEKIYSDTLVFYDNVSDPFSYYMTKVDP